MLAREMLIKQFEYNAWANGRLLDEAAKLSEEEWTGKLDAAGNSLHEILAHLLRTERVWRLLSAHGRIERDALPSAEELATVDSLRVLNASENELMLILLNDWSTEAFSEVEQVTRWDGQVVPLVRWHMLQHMLLHSMQHRSEAALLLTAHGRSPGDLDFIFF